MLSPKAFTHRFRGWVIGAGIFGFLVLSYALLIEQAVLLGFVLVAWIFGLFVTVYLAYLFYHFVHSVSRIADAMEAREAGSERAGRPDDGGDATE